MKTATNKTEAQAHDEYLSSTANVIRNYLTAMRTCDRETVMDRALDGICRRCWEKTVGPCHCDNDE